MTDIEIKVELEGREFNYEYMNIGTPVSNFGVLRDGKMGLGYPRVHSFTSTTYEENIEKLAQYLVDEGYKVFRVKPKGNDWTISKLLINYLHKIRLSNLLDESDDEIINLIVM
jgi:hypothetical protein